ncbi:MAG: ATP-binding protein [Treponema sp.]|nr:ATP-binding protein [Treponema sp.]
MENTNSQVNFRVSSAIKDLIGKDLIRNDYVAIFELVKNSYDAYAKKVQITFEDNRITIADNGKGMTFNDLEEKWLFLAYSAKKDGSEDSEKEKQTSYRDMINRHYAGAKGVGRFSCDRLGENLILTTKNEKSLNVERITIDWKQFEKDQKEEFEEIKFSHEIVPDDFIFPDNANTGTVLKIDNLREPWNREKILELKSSLEKLINPFSESIDFEIEFICEKERNEDEKTKQNKLFLEKDIVNGVLSNSISKVISLKTTKIEVTLNKDKIKTILTDRDKKIYELEELNIYDKLEDVSINLYFLNQAAKTAFSKKMGVQPVNYGSIMLFRNGFRILPFGNPGDDSWKLDYRSQQGYNRFLGTRDLFGRVDIQTDKIEEFKEVSSRDGGLIQSKTTIQLNRLFEITHRRLERYVAGVLWGEAFLKKEYFKNTSKENIDSKRDILKNKDKFSDSSEYIFTSSLGSKIDFVNLVKTLINDKSVNVVYYNKDLANIFSQPTLFDDANPQVIDDLERIAQKTNDSDLLFSVDEAKKKILDLQKEKEAAENRAEEAEARATKADNDRDTAIFEKNIAEVKKEQAEQETKKVQKEKEQIASENLFLLSDVNQDVKQLQCLQHHITHTSSFINELTLKALDSLKNNDIETATSYLQKILFENTKITTVSAYVSKAKFDVMANKIKNDIVMFINEYLENVYSHEKDAIKVDLQQTSLKYEIKFSPIEIIVVIDNLVSNAKKANAKNIATWWDESETSLLFHFADDGNGISSEIVNRIFDYRFTTTNGGGLGLYHSKEIMNKLHGNILVRNDNNTEFILEFYKGGK